MHHTWRRRSFPWMHHTLSYAVTRHLEYWASPRVLHKWVLQNGYYAQQNGYCTGVQQNGYCTGYASPRVLHWGTTHSKMGTAKWVLHPGYCTPCAMRKWEYHLLDSLGYCTPCTMPPRSDRRTSCPNSSGLSRNTRAASWLSGSVGFGSEKRCSSPKMTAEMLKTGFHSSRNKFKQTLPWLSIFGWKTAVSHFTFGASWGYLSMFV